MFNMTRDEKVLWTFKLWY